MNVPQSGYEQPGLVYQQYQTSRPSQVVAMNVDAGHGNQTQPQQAYHPNNSAYMNSWAASSSANLASASYAQSGPPPQSHGPQPQPMNYEYLPQTIQDFDTPQVQSSAGPSRAPRRQNALEKVIQADPTRKASASRNARPRGKRGDEPSSSRSVAQSSTRSSQVPPAAAQNLASASAQSSSTSAQPTQSPTAGTSGSATPATTRDHSVAEDVTGDDDNASSGAKKKSRLTSLDRRDICIFHRDTPGVRQEDIAKRWGIDRSSISKILKEKTRWLAIPVDETMEVAKAKPPKYEQIDQKLKEWLLDKVKVGSSVSDNEIREKALEFAKDSPAATAAFKASHGWVDKFKLRVGISKGVYLGFGTENEKNRALGNGVGNLPDPLDSIAPTMMDNLCRTGEWDPNAAARDVVYEIPKYKMTAQQLTEKRGGRWWHELTEEEQEASIAAGDDDFYPPYKMMTEETKLEKAAVEAAEKETVALQNAARAAGEPFDFKETFDEIVREKLGAIDYETIDVPELDIPTVPGQHPDDIEPTPGPSGERAHEAIWEVIRFCMPRRGRVFSNAHCAVLFEIWARTAIIYERQRRAGERRAAYEEIYYKDRENDVAHAEEMIADKERDFALNPTGEPTGRDVVARQIRKENLEALRELKSARDELVEDPKAAVWLGQVHNAQRTEVPDVDEASEPSGSRLAPPPPQSETQPVASSSSPSSSPEQIDAVLLTPPYAVHDDTVVIYTMDTPRDQRPDCMNVPGTNLIRIEAADKPYRSLEEVHAMMAELDPVWGAANGYPPASGDPDAATPGLFGDSPRQDYPSDVIMHGYPPS